MKKLIALLLCMAMLLSLAACGGKEPVEDDKGKEGTTQTVGGEPDTPSEDPGTTEPQPSEPVPTEPSEPTPSDPTDPEPSDPEQPPMPVYELQFSEKQHPALPAMNWQPQGKGSVTATPYGCDLEVFYEQLQSIPYFQENFDDLTYTTEEKYTTDDNFPIELYVTESFMLSGDQKYIRFSFYRNAALYSDASSVHLSTYGVELTTELQNALCEAYEKAGLPVMSYALTARDPDGKNEYGEDFNSWESAAESMGETITAEDGVTYHAKRSVEKDYSGMSADLSIGNDGIYYSIRYNAMLNYSYKEGAYVSLYEKAPYQFDDLASAEFGDYDPFAETSFGDRLLGSIMVDYQKTSIPEFTTKRVRYMDGSVTYTFDLLLRCESTDEQVIPERMNYAMMYTVGQDGTLSDVDVGIKTRGIGQTPQGSSKEVLFQEGVRVVQTMIGGIDMTNFSYEDSETRREQTTWSKDLPAVIFGQDVQVDDVMLVYDGEELTVSVNIRLLAMIGSPN